jgi:K+-sensing histidine kinase KdpD
MRVAAKGLTLLARAILAIATLVFLVMAVAILVVLLQANPSNSLVEGVIAAADFLAGPFNGLFTFRDAQVERAVNWGIAAFVWLIVGALIAGLLRRLAGRGRGRRRKS